MLASAFSVIPRSPRLLCAALEMGSNVSSASLAIAFNSSIRVPCLRVIYAFRLSFFVLSMSFKPATKTGILERRLLGRVDGFNQYQCASEADEGGVAGCGLIAAHGDAFEAFEFADRLLDACASAV